MKRLPAGDINFLQQKAMPYFGISYVKLCWSSSKKQWPDIWAIPSESKIVVTQEWLRQPAGERRKRLVHECLHFLGLEHGIYDGLEYSTYPKEDMYSLKIYRDIVGG